MGTAIITGGMLLVSLVYTDFWQASLYLFILLLTGLYRIFIAWSGSFRTLVATGLLLHVLIAFGLVMVQPLGPVLMAHFLPMALTFGSVSRKPWLPAGLMVLLILIPAFVQPLHFPLVPEPKAPQLLSLFITITACAVIAYKTVQRNAAKVKEHIQHLELIQAYILDQTRKIQAQEFNLQQLNEELSQANEHTAERARAEIALTQEIARQSADQESLVHAIHHDLREPLRSIVSFSQLIQRKLDAEQQGAAALEYLQFAIDGGRRMANMLDDLIRYTRHEEEPRSTIDLNHVIQRVLLDLHANIVLRQAKILMDPMPTVLGYETQLHQLFLNLLSNALKFHKPGEVPDIQIRCSLDPTRQYCNIEVIDKGIGIPDSLLEAIFGLFTRAHSKDSYEGNGVGLALCKRIVLAHDAKLSASSDAELGTRFLISKLPTATSTTIPATRSKTTTLSLSKHA